MAELQCRLVEATGGGQSTIIDALSIDSSRIAATAATTVDEQVSAISQGNKSSPPPQSVAEADETSSVPTAGGWMNGEKRLEKTIQEIPTKDAKPASRATTVARSKSISVPAAAINDTKSTSTITATATQPHDQRSVSQPPMTTINTSTAKKPRHRFRRRPRSSPSTPLFLTPTFLADSPVTLHVGGPQSPSCETEPVTFHVHSQLLIQLSPFFRSAFAERGFGGVEAQTKVMRLPEERPEDWVYLLRWVYWHAATSALRSLAEQHDTKEERRLNLLSSSSKGTATLMDMYGNPSSSSGITSEEITRANGKSQSNQSEAEMAAEDLGLWHEQIDKPLLEYAEYKYEREKVLKGSRPGNDISQLIIPRPPPPTFGPLIRLYVLADRFDVGAGLRKALCRRVAVVALGSTRSGDYGIEEGNGRSVVVFVPGKEDVELLWDQVSSNISSELKDVILELYMDMKGTSVFRHGDDDDDWHPGFLRDLVCRLLNARSGKDAKAKSKQGVEMREKD